jgi:hypothetical protein
MLAGGLMAQDLTQLINFVEILIDIKEILEEHDLLSRDIERDVFNNIIDFLMAKYTAELKES